MTHEENRAQVEAWGFGRDMIAGTFPHVAAKYGFEDPSLGSEAIGAFQRLLARIATVNAIAKVGFDPTVRAVGYMMNSESPNVIPGASDLVRFELREVFREPDRTNALTPPPSDTFLELMRKHGYSRYHAENYWAAHWELPGLNVGFDMLHRLRPGRVEPELVFTADDMRELLKKQDVLPIYHDRLMATSYLPLTRVDVRRMFKLGVLDKAQVAEAYKDLGYDDVNAAFLADFTEADVRLEERELTRGDWIASYREDLVTEKELRDALTSMRYPEDAADFVLRLENKRKANEAQRERDALDRKVRTIGQRVRRHSRAGKLDDEAVTQELEALGLQPSDITGFFARFKVAPLPVSKDLTRADELAAFRYGITSEAELRERLAAKGLDEKEVAQLVAVEKKKMQKGPAKQKELSKTEVLSLLKKGLMTADEAVDRLVRAGYSEEDATRLVVAALPTE